MSSEVVTVGCRLPNGLKLEVGYSTSQQGAGGAPFVMYRKGADYQTFTLKGTNQRLFVRGPDGKILTTLVSARDKEPYLNQGVPKDLFDRWCAEHRDAWVLKSGQVFLVPKPADTAAVMKDAQATSANILEPLDPSKTFKIDGMEINRRTDDL